MRRSLPIVVCWLLANGCETPGVTLVEPETQGADATPAIVHVTLEDSAMAAALGWNEGVPNALVILHRFIDPFRPESLRTNDRGRVAVSGQVPGWYRVAGYRALTEDEGRVVGETIAVLGDGVKAVFPAKLVQLRLRTHQPGSVVLSEYYQGGGTINIEYRWAQFVELFNNADTVIYLDGMLFGSAWGKREHAISSCDERRGLREDSLGLWAAIFHKFPGNGTDYPLLPGDVATVAVDAVDHSQVHPTLPDLSQADFELEGRADTDNPDVPNMPSVGTVEEVNGHGWRGTVSNVLFIASALDPNGLDVRVAGNDLWKRIPLSAVLDVMHGDWVSTTSEPPFVWDEYCSWVNRSLDRLEAAWWRPASDNRIGLHRRILRLSGRAILQDVGTSFLDFDIGPHTPGSVGF